MVALGVRQDTSRTKDADKQLLLPTHLFTIGRLDSPIPPTCLSVGRWDEAGQEYFKHHKGNSFFAQIRDNSIIYSL